MISITIYLDAATEARLRQISDETSRRCEELAESAVAETALDFFLNRKDDPGRAMPRASGFARAAMEASL